MNFVNQSAFLKALGWSLLDSLWQIGVLWLLYICLTANGKRFRARQRHTLALLSLAGGSLWFLVTLVINFYQAAAAPAIITVIAGSEAVVAASSGSFLNNIAAWLEPALPFLSVAYLLVAAFLFIRFYRHYRYTKQLFTSGLQKAHPEWRVFLQRAAAHMGVKKKVSIWFSSLVDTPLTIGFWKPLILLPVAAVNQLSIQQAEAIILHELNHIRRNDYLVNLLIACADIILFFNPFARLLTAAIRKERENSCDDLVLQFRYDAPAYAQALLTLEQHRVKHTASLAVAATGKNQQLLLNRVKRILYNEPVTTPLGQRLLAYLLSAFLIGFIGLSNPGKVIIKTIDEVVAAQPAVSEEMVAGFTTPPGMPADEDAVDEPARPSEAAVEGNSDEAIANDDAEPIDALANKLEQLIEMTADMKLAAVSQQLETLPEQVAEFVSAYETIDYSLPENNGTGRMAPGPNVHYPFVPNSSFSYQLLEDTTLPKKYILTTHELQAREAMDKALLALQLIDWKQIEKEISANGQAPDIAKVKVEIARALKDVNWDKINEEVENAVSEAKQEIIQQQNTFRVQLGNYQREKARQTEQLKQAQNQILKDRLEQHQQLKKLEAEKRRTNNCTCPETKKKKIVHI